MGSGQYLLGRQRPRRLPLFGIVLGLMLVGCNSNPEPAPLPTEGVTSSATTTPTQSPTPPTMPAEAEGTNKAAAKAFVRHYIDLVNHAMATGDVEPLRRSSAPSCSSCEAVIENIDGLYGAGGRLEGEGWEVTALQLVSRQGASRPIVQAGIMVHPQRRIAHQEAVPEHFDGGRNLMTFFLKRSAQVWAVTKWDQVG